LLGCGFENLGFSHLAGYNHDVRRPIVYQLYAAAESFRIGNSIPWSPWVGFAEQHVFNDIPVLGGEDSVVQLWAQLIEAMAHEVIGACDSQEVASDRNHFHTVLDGLRKIKNVLGRPTIENTRKREFEMFGYRLVEVMDNGGLLIGRVVEGLNSARSKPLKKGLDEMSVKELGCLLIRYTQRVAQIGSFQLAIILPADHHRRTERQTPFSGFGKEAQNVGIDSHGFPPKWISIGSYYS
jgi:hypothetical protein